MSKIVWIPERGHPHGYVTRGWACDKCGLEYRNKAAADSCCTNDEDMRALEARGQTRMEGL